MEITLIIIFLLTVVYMFYKVDMDCKFIERELKDLREELQELKDDLGV